MSVGLASRMKVAHVVLVAGCVMDCFIQIRCNNAHAAKLIDLSDSSNNSYGLNQKYIEGVLSRGDKANGVDGK